MENKTSVNPEIEILIASAKDSILNFLIQEDVSHLMSSLMEVIRVLEISHLNSVEVVPSKKITVEEI